MTFRLRVLICWSWLLASAVAQTLVVYPLENETIHLDGILDEPAWQRADAITHLTMVEPHEGAEPTFQTIVKVLADERHIYLGIMCYDPQPDKIVVYSRIRDSYLRSEDWIKFVLDTNRDQRTGFIFGVNPAGTRYDALVANFGEGENRNWDGIWDARTQMTREGWSVEIVIPIHTLTYAAGQREWGFNIERNIQRLLERDRWTGARRDYRLGQLAHAGLLVGLPAFQPGYGVTLKLSGINRMENARHQHPRYQPDLSLDVIQKITPDVTAQLTVNTDFAETEVDARRTNLTRFPLFFPEKRAFFLEGSDVFSFGIGLGREVIPFFSRRIGLYRGQKVPILWGGKLNGRVRNTNFGALVTRTEPVAGLVPATTMGAFRIKQNVLSESAVGLIGTWGDPLGVTYAWLLGVDMTYRTSVFRGDKNFLAGVWFLQNHHPGRRGGDRAMGFKIDYPNDLWDVALTVKMIGQNFQPSLGFVPRPGIISYRMGVDYMPRPQGTFIRRFFFESGLRYITDLHHRWESYSLFTAPIHFLLESGDRFEFNIMPQGEYLKAEFPIRDGVIIPPGAYHWWRYRLEFESASKRWISGQATWWFGSFYEGRLDQIELRLRLRPASNFNFYLNFEKNVVRLPQGNFTQNLFGSRFQFSLSPDFEVSSFIQYDSDSRSLGSNTRLRWHFSMLGDLFIVYNHNLQYFPHWHWQYDSNQLIVKLSYGLWY
ncbi:MAG: carbohydrate binding family 9 domain-containing protein [Calditrichaeota bacterium]|nr:carbohydrate binding family 9 domain-containing protein [Calditrichota bacterium]